MCFVPLSHIKILLQKEDKTRDPHHDKAEVIPSHSAQVQFCACTNVKQKYHILRLLSPICGHDHTPFLKQLSVLVTHLLKNHFPLLATATIHTSVQVHLQALPPSAVLMVKTNRPPTCTKQVFFPTSSGPDISFLIQNKNHPMPKDI